MRDTKSIRIYRDRKKIEPCQSRRECSRRMFICIEPSNILMQHRLIAQEPQALREPFRDDGKAVALNRHRKCEECPHAGKGTYTHTKRDCFHIDPSTENIIKSSYLIFRTEGRHVLNEFLSIETTNRYKSIQIDTSIQIEIHLDIFNQYKYRSIEK